MSVTPAIRVENLSKRYGAVHAVNGLSFEAMPGDVFGFLGPNGAGKTTTMRILATLLRQDSGTAQIMGFHCGSEAKSVRPLIGYMPDSTGAYRDMFVSEYLEFFAAAYRVPAEKREQVVNDCIALTGLDFKRDSLIEGLSRGMRQRLGLARCLIHDPKVLILDEPASGLDPRARIEIQEVLRTLGKMGKTILISSHILSELRTLCNKIGIVDSGRMIYSGTIAEALEHARTARRVFVRLVEGHDRAEGLMAARSEVVSAAIDDDGVLVLELHEHVEDHSFVAQLLVENGHRVLTIREEDILLEDAFLKLTGAGSGAD